jgi:UDP-arabinose 4-epimerase
MPQSVLVTGGAGYIGSHTCKALARAGFTPVAFDNLSLGHRNFVRWGPLVERDIGDPSAVAEACRRHGVIAAIHFAGNTLVEESVSNPVKYYRANVAGTLALLEGLREAGVNALVFSSTCAIYGAPAEQPIAESTPTNPINPYGTSKLMVEQVLADCARAYGLRYAALRYFNACGADPDGEVGELRSPESHLIPRAMMWLQGHLDDFRVFGTDYPTPDGTAIRDYIHVCDLAQAHVLALRRLVDGWEGGALNLGTGRGASVREVLQEISRATKTELDVADGRRRAGDPPVLVADPTRASELLGFSAKQSDLTSIVRTAWAWHRKAHPLRRANSVDAVRLHA